MTAMLCLFVQAPFAACRTFTAGWYRPTARFLTPSAAYGLILNVAGIETRLPESDPAHTSRTPTTLMRPGLPKVRLAIGIPKNGADSPEPPRVHTIFQQLHNYPVGKDAGIPEELAKGRKNNITPVRREFLADLKTLVCVDDNAEVEERIRRGLRGQWNCERYGLPFLGDNQFLIDRLEERPWPQEAFWYERVRGTSAHPPRPHTTRLTVWIDRADMSKTVSSLYAPTQRATNQISEDAWTTIPP